MVLACSPQQEATTLRFTSPSNLHQLDATSALIQLRQSLSRSPSKSPAFRLVTGKNNHSTKSPLAPTPYSPRRTINRFQVPTISLPQSGTRTPSPVASPLDPEFPATHRGSKLGGRKLSPLRAVPKGQVTARSQTVKRVLGESRDNGNASPLTLQRVTCTNIIGSRTMEQSGSVVQPPRVNFKGFIQDASNISHGGSIHQQLEPPQPPQSPFSFRNDRHTLHFADAPVKSSPLKRVEGPSRTDPTVNASPSAKRRSLHGTSDFNIFGQFIDEEGSGNDSTPHESAESFEETVGPSPVSKRAGSLRKSTIQQRHERPSLARIKASSNLSQDFGTPSALPASAPRKSSEGIRSLPTRRNLFANDHPRGAGSAGLSNETAIEPPRAHPLSNAVSQASSGSELAQDSPTHAPVRASMQRKSLHAFARSLPLGIERHHASLAHSSITAPGDIVTETPDSYRFAKPLQTVFNTTGLISKRTKDLRDQASNSPAANMPDTPCKRPMPANPMAPSATPAPPPRHTQLRRNAHAFGTPSTPFVATTSRPTPGANGQGVGIFGSTMKTLNRRGSFLSVESDDNGADVSMSQLFELPATPSKPQSTSNTSVSCQKPLAATRVDEPGTIINDVETLASSPHLAFNSPASPHQHGGHTSPHTPKDVKDGMGPPDPSGLSISVRNAHAVDLRQSTFAKGFSGSIPPATPTANRESSRFQSHRLDQSSVQAIAEAQLDPSLTSRFDEIEMIGDGEFSSVFRVAKNAEATRSAAASSYFGSFDSDSATSQQTARPRRVYAVKKSRNPYLGQKDRARKLREVEVLAALGRSEHTIELLDHWECEAHLYIQTDYCEEGSLDRFLAEVGQKARLDDFRIWKILIETGKGLAHIHSCGFMHLDLKPANILISFNGALKIADFGMASSWPAAPGIEAEGDREYIGPEILVGEVDKPSDVYALGLIVFEIAGNVVLPDNGASWQRLRQGDISDVKSLTSLAGTPVLRDNRGMPIDETGSDVFKLSDTNHSDFSEVPRKPLPRLLSPPPFMVDREHPQSLEHMVTWMINPQPSLRPDITELLESDGCVWVDTRRRSPATIYEGEWGPELEATDLDTEMMDV